MSYFIWFYWQQVNYTSVLNNTHCWTVHSILQYSVYWLQIEQNANKSSKYQYFQGVALTRHKSWGTGCNQSSSIDNATSTSAPIVDKSVAVACGRHHRVMVMPIRCVGHVPLLPVTSCCIKWRGHPKDRSSGYPNSIYLPLLWAA